MKKTILGTVSAIALGFVSPASAAPPDSPAMMFNWTGCYVGGHVGYGWSKNKGMDYGSPSYAIDYNGNGGLYGGQIGCNYQAAGSPWVFGVQGAYSGANINGHGQNNQGTDVSNKIKSLGSITGRIGFTGFNPQTIIYGKGGWGFAKQDQFLSGAGTADVSRSGWTAGAGVEWALDSIGWRNWSTFLEYEHYQFGTKTYGVGIFEETTKTSVDVIKLGLNYRFSLPPPPP
jgi:outer membrane immunogenic protein